MYHAPVLLAAFATALLPACSEEAGNQASCASATGHDSGPAKTPEAARPAPDAPTLVLPEAVAGIEFPRTTLARAAAQLAFEASPEVLYNHLLRSYVFGGLYLRTK